MPASHHTLPRVFGHVSSTGAYNRFIYTIFLQCCTKELPHKFTYKRAGRPCQLKGPATSSLVGAPPRHLLAASAPVGSSIQWSGRSLTAGH